MNRDCGLFGIEPLEQGTVCAVALVGTDAFGLVAALLKLW